APEPVPFIIGVCVCSIRYWRLGGGIAFKTFSVNAVRTRGAEASTMACTECAFFFIAIGCAEEVSLSVAGVFGYYINNAVHRVCAPERAARSTYDFNPFDIF